jgi:hypothetical protein
MLDGDDESIAGKEETMPVNGQGNNISIKVYDIDGEEDDNCIELDV